MSDNTPSEIEPPKHRLTEAISMNSLLLSIFAIITTGACVLTYTLSAERIEQNRQHALESRLSEVMPAKLYDNDLLNSTLTLADPSVTGPIYQASYQGKPVGVIIPTYAPDGYGGAIELLVGILDNGSITGVRVVPPHLETPGLGDAIDIKKSDWIKSFNGQSLQATPIERWAVKKEGGDFDQFTGATITPRAVIRAVKHSLQLFEEHYSILIPTQQAPATAVPAEQGWAEPWAPAPLQSEDQDHAFEEADQHE